MLLREHFKEKGEGAMPLLQIGVCSLVIKMLKLADPEVWGKPTTTWDRCFIYGSFLLCLIGTFIVVRQ